MSYREKVTWGGLAGPLGVWGVYFAALIADIAAGGLTRPDFIADFGGRFVHAVALIIVLEIVLAIVLAATTPAAEQVIRDEREQLAVLRSDSLAFGLLCVLLVTLALTAYGAGIGADFADVLGAFGERLTANALVLMANAVLFCLLFADVVRYAARLWLLNVSR